MSKHQKLIQRLISLPRDFTWDELKSVLSGFGYIEKKGSGSRRKFVNEKKEIISLHEPHPQNILKRYALEIVIEHLKEKGDI